MGSDSDRDSLRNQNHNTDEDTKANSEEESFHSHYTTDNRYDSTNQVTRR